MGADLARAEIRPCTEEEASTFDNDAELPVLCDVMTVTAVRPQPAEQETAQFDFRVLFDSAEMRSDAARRMQNTRLFGDVAS